MATYNLKDLLPEHVPLPYFEPGDVIDFPKSDTSQPDKAAIACAELLRVDIQEEWVRLEPTDYKSMRKRLFGKQLITGLQIINLQLEEKGEHLLLVNEQLRPALGWMGQMSIVQALPGFTTPIAATFPYATLLSTNNRGTVLRTGPYDPTKHQIGEIAHPKLQDARKRSQAIGRGSMAMGGTRTTPNHSSLTDRID